MRPPPRDPENACAVASYQERPPPPRLARFVACTWVARADAQGDGHVARIIPDGCIDLLWSEGRLTIAGPDTESALLPAQPRREIVGVRFRPGIAPSILGVPASALRDARIEAGDVLGGGLAPLLDRLRRAEAPAAKMSILEDQAARWLERRRPIDRLVERSIGVTRASLDRPSVATLAASLGVSERQLQRRFVDAVGYGPKVFQRIVRLQRFVAASAAPPVRTLAALATEAGYADQSHLAREVHALAGCRPTDLLGYPITAG